MLFAHGVDAPLAHAVTHELDQVGPHDDELLATHLTPRAVGVDARPIERLSPVDVAHACEDRLVHEQATDRGSTAVHALPCTLGVGVLADWVGADALRKRRHLVGREHFARGGPAQVGVGRLAHEPQPHLADRLGRGALGETPLAVQPEVDMKCPVVIEVDEQVLAECIGLADGRSVKEGRAVGEAPLRAGHLEGLALECPADAASLAVDDVTFGHGS